MKKQVSSLLVLVLATCGGTYRGCRTTRANNMELHHEDVWQTDVKQHDFRGPTLMNDGPRDDTFPR